MNLKYFVTRPLVGLFLFFSLFLFLSGFVETTPHSFGRVEAFALDGVHKAIWARNKYCAATTVGAKAVLKSIALTAIRVYVPLYPADGICTDLFNQVVEIIPIK